MLGCYLSLPPDAPLYEKTLAFDCAGNYGSLDAYCLLLGHIPGSHFIHTGPFDSRLCIFPRDHSHHVVDQCIYRCACVGRGRLSRTVLLPAPNYSVVLCVEK